MASLILFYSHGCIHCNHFMPVWEKIKSYCSKKLKDVKIHEVESGEMQLMQFEPSRNTTGVDLNEITGFPTIMIRRNTDGKLFPIEDRRQESIIKKLKSVVGENKHGGDSSDENDSKKLNGGKKNKKVKVQTGGGNNSEFYREKYLKYKKKYLDLKNSK